MNENTAKLIEQIAKKLGTTSEYLWGVLLKQASISAVTSLIQFFIVLIFGIFLFLMHKRFMKEGEINVDFKNMYERHELSLFIPMIFGAITFIVLFIVCFCTFGSIINGFFNPEYWALREILGEVR